MVVHQTTSTTYEARVLRAAEKAKSRESDKNPQQEQPGDWKPVEPPSWPWLNFLFTAFIYFSYQAFVGNKNNAPTQAISWQDFRSRILPTGEVDHLVVDPSGEVVYVHLRDGAVIDGHPVQRPHQHGGLRQFRFTIASVESFESQLEQAQNDLNIDPDDFIPVSFVQPIQLEEILAGILPVIVVGSIWFLMIRRSKPPVKSGSAESPFFGLKFEGKTSHTPGPMGMGRMRPTIVMPGDPEAKKTSFADVAGLTEAKMEVMEFVQFLHAPENIAALGGHIPKGALLVGPPGTGKTLLAKAIAGEANVPFFAVSGSDFVEMFVGVGPSRVRDLFAQARENAPCILYIDEIDAVGKARGSGGVGRADSERENTLNQLLVEMDGFNSTAGLIMLASTNRSDVLDRALLRPGRFDRQIMCDLPFRQEREAIFRVHLRGIKAAGDLDAIVTKMAALTPGLSGAQIASICNESALHAAREGKQEVELKDFEYGVDRVVSGMERKRIVSPEEKQKIAFHEAGHTILSWYLEHIDPILKVTILPRGSTLGSSQHMPSDQKLYTTEQLLDKMCQLLGGRMAESLALNSISTGANDDLQRVTRIAYQMVTSFGMNEQIGNIHLRMPQPDEGRRPFSNNLSEKIDAEVHRLIREASHRTEAILRTHMDKLQPLATKLIETESLNYEDIQTILGPRPFGDGNPLTAQQPKD